MISFTLVGAALVAVTVIVHATGTLVLIRLLSRNQPLPEQELAWNRILWVLVGTVLLLLFLHVIEILLWAIAYLALELSDLQTFEEAVYFSFVTYTTLGYGDITLTGPWRIMSGIEALNGVLLAGWSTAALFAIVEKILQSFQSNRGSS